MAYNELLGDRINQYLKEKSVSFYEKRMFGGLVFMVDDKMCVGINKSSMMVRTNPDYTKELLKIEGCSMMDFTKKPMKGYFMIAPEAYDMDEDLEFWIDKALIFNPLAKSSKRK